MADKSFGVKEVNLIGASGTPTIESPNNLNINAVNVAISTDMSVGGTVTIGTGATISSPATNVLTLGTNSVERVRIDSNGHIGIANSSPTTWGTGIPTIEIKGTVSTGGQSTRSGAIAFESGSGSNGYAVLWGQEGGIHIYTGATDRASATYRAKFDSTGNLAFASGNGIDFSANSNAAGMTSELLDDYEEGTFTPTFTAGTVSGGYTRQVGEYTKVGRLVTFTLTIDGDGNLQGAAQAIEIGGLPFTSRNVAEIGGAQVTYPGNFDTTNNRRFWLVAQNNTTLSYRDSSANNINGNAVNNVNSQLNLCGYYFTDS